MNQKGLTLVEMIAVLIVLAVIATIVTPNINGSIKNYKQQLYETQMGNINNAAKNWSADYVDKLPETSTITISNTEYTYGLKITVQELQQGGYISDTIKNPKDGNLFSSTETFTLVTCKVYTDETGTYSDNYDYTYETYLNENEYLEQKAIEYAEDNTVSSTTTITTSQLQTANYVVQKLITTDGTTSNVSSKTILITNNNGDYSATVQ